MSLRKKFGSFLKTIYYNFFVSKNVEGQQLNFFSWEKSEVRCTAMLLSQNITIPTKA